MTRMIPSSGLFLTILLAASACSASEPTTSEPAVAVRPAANSSVEASTDEPAAPTKGPVVVELFTSQGCSSCPPADRILSEIGSGKFGEDVIALAFHVDYWNYIGWKDPFSKAKWSTLQRLYGAKLSEGRVYTPMLVVAGASHVVGSRRKRVADAIKTARSRPDRTSVSIEVAERSATKIVATIGAAKLGNAELWVAVTESGLETAVQRGENSGRELRNDHIVRELIRVEQPGQVSIAVDPSWSASNLKLVAFARDPSNFAIVGASVGL